MHLQVEFSNIEDIQKSIEYLEQPGYNCDGLVTADGVIAPRTKILQEVLRNKLSRKEKEGCLSDQISKKW